MQLQGHRGSLGFSGDINGRVPSSTLGQALHHTILEASPRLLRRKRFNRTIPQRQVKSRPGLRWIEAALAALPAFR